LHFNLDGLVAATTPRVYTYAQAFRTGALEYVVAEQFSSAKDLYGVPLEQRVIDATSEALTFMRHHGLVTPIVVFLTLIGCRGLTVSAGSARSWETHSPIDRDVVALPDVVADAYDVDVASLLRPTFDVMWQASGWQGSPSYDANGARKQPT
jgi:hypothetical protein